MEEFVSILQSTWEYVPFPVPLLLVIAGGFAWLWLELQTTRAGRALPGWRRPLPLLPEISVVGIWAIRISWILLRVWIVLFVAMAFIFWIQSITGYSDWLGDVTLIIGRVWRGAYDISMEWLLDLQVRL